MSDLFAPFTYTIRNGWGEIISRNATLVRFVGSYSAIFKINGRDHLVARSRWNANDLHCK